MQHKKSKYIAVMGTMGSGKTTLSKLVAKELGFHLLEENFGENAFLSRFYKEMPRWAFHSQTFFLMEKINQMLETPKLLDKYSVVQDTPITQDVFSYAKAQYVLGNIDEAEWKLYQKIYKSFEPYFAGIDLIIYLETPVNIIHDRISKRARDYEQKIPQSYLELLDMLNHKWLSENKNFNVLKIETDGLNIVRSRAAQKTMIAMIRDRLKTL